MSEKESTFIRTLWASLGTLAVTFLIGGFLFYQGQLTQDAVQDQRIDRNTQDIHQSRVEVKDDLNKINAKIDRLIELQLNSKL